MDIRDFGDELIRTGDLDPCYIAIHGAKIPEPQLCRLLLAYWCFYHLGFAGWVSEQQDYWDRMLIAASNLELPHNYGIPVDRWPRGTERRHFRGEACVKAVQWFLCETPEQRVRRLAEFRSDAKLMAYVTTWPQFGPWIAFKVADMMERVYGASVQFNPNLGLMYREPRAGLDLLAADQTFITTDRSVDGLYRNLATYFSAHRAPPGKDRWCGPQEVETILCKWKSMKTGHYWVGKDIKEVRHGLIGWGATAERMLNACPQEISKCYDSMTESTSTRVGHSGSFV